MLAELPTMAERSFFRYAKEFSATFERDSHIRIIIVWRYRSPECQPSRLRFTQRSIRWDVYEQFSRG